MIQIEYNLILRI